MNAQDIQRIVSWLSESSLQALHLQGPGLDLRLTQPVAPTQAAMPPTASGPAPGTVLVKAPMVGIFLDAHPLRGSPLASIGTTVQAGQVLGLMQVGELLLPIKAPVHGLLTAALLAPDTATGYGTALFSITPSA